VCARGIASTSGDGGDDLHLVPRAARSAELRAAYEVPDPAGGPPRQVNCANDQFTTDGVTPAIREFGMLHEILHTMGLVDPKLCITMTVGIQAIIRRICCTAAHSIGVQVPSTPAVTTISELLIEAGRPATNDNDKSWL
jgi:hypothetical protein